jgi:hypothetical protein
LLFTNFIYFIFEFSFWSWTAKHVKVKKARKGVLIDTADFKGVYKAME